MIFLHHVRLKHIADHVSNEHQIIKHANLCYGYIYLNVWILP